MKVFYAIGRSFKVLYEELFLFVLLSILWWLGTIPLLLVGYSVLNALATGAWIWLAIALLGIVLTPISSAVTVGLHCVANRVANYKRVDSGFFYQAARQRLRSGWLLYALTIVLFAGLGFNVIFYISQPTQWAQIIGFAWVWGLLLLMMASQYFFPLFWQQEDPSLRLILRNGVLLAIRHPLYSFLLLLFIILLVVISVVTVLPILVLMPAAIVVASNVGLVYLLQELGLAPPPPPNA